MSEPTLRFSPRRNVSPAQAQAFLYEDEGSMSSIQALINILRKPQETYCIHCWGRGLTVVGASCDRCLGTGKGSGRTR